MMLIEQTVVPDAALPVDEFRKFLRLGTGFAGGGVEEDALEGCLRTALATVEARVGKAVLTRQFKYTLVAWRDLAAQTLPVAPVSSITSLEIVDLGGAREVIDAAAYRLQPDMHRPKLVSVGWTLPTIPVGGQAEIVFEAGFAAAWSSVPPDLAQAVLMLAAHYHDVRGAIGEGPDAVPLGVRDILSRYRVVRLFGGL